MTTPDPLDQLRRALPADYRVDEYLDRGGQGYVFKGAFRGAPAAIKLFTSTASAARLARELDLLSRVRCRSLVTVLGHGIITFQGVPTSLVAYELHPGGDLRRFLDPTAPPVGFATLQSVGLAIGEAIEALWGQRIVHRDIKPANVVRASDGRFVVVDVGLARHVDRSDLTRPGAAPGTEGYKSPEQAAGRRALTIHSDVFSTGITLYELAACAHPFQRLQVNIGVVPPPDLRAVRGDLPVAFCELVRQAMSLRPADRPRDFRARLQGMQGP